MRVLQNYIGLKKSPSNSLGKPTATLILVMISLNPKYSLIRNGSGPDHFGLSGLHCTCVFISEIFSTSIKFLLMFCIAFLTHKSFPLYKIFSQFFTSRFHLRNLFPSILFSLNTRAVQKVRSRIFCLFFRQHWSKLPQGECSGGLYNYTVKIWRLYICFSSCFSLVKVELPVAGATKFETCVVIRFYILKVSWLTLEVIFLSFSSWNPLLRCPRS